MRQHSGRLLPVGRNDDDGYDDVEARSAADVRFSARARARICAEGGGRGGGRAQERRSLSL